MDGLPPALAQRLAELMPGARVVAWQPIGHDAGGDETLKAQGYAKVMKVQLRRADGSDAAVVFHLATADDFGHDRRADRAANQLLAFDTFSSIPQQAQALDVGALTHDGRLVSLADAGELYLVTEWAEGEVYAADLRRLATGPATELDLARLDALAKVLAELHAHRVERPAAYTRAVRDLVGSGEGLAGIVDGFGDGAPGAPRARLDALERRCLAWRHRLKGRVERLRRTHGDFHPFNLLFAPGHAVPTLLDASRGAAGDPADDVACLGLNFLFFSLGHEATARALRDAWRRWWERCARSGEVDVLEAAAPYLAWRALVVTNPAWYPHLGEGDRHRLLTFAERALEAPRFDPRLGEAVMDQAPLELSSPAPGVVVWLTGIPSSGKTTLAKKVAALLGPGGCALLDGDEVRASLVPTPGYDEAGRDAFYRTLGQLAATLARQGQVVLVAATANRQRYRDEARALAPRFVEVFVDTPLATCRARDAKGLYRAGAAGLPGAGADYEVPRAPELWVHADDVAPELTLLELLTPAD